MPSILGKAIVLPLLWALGSAALLAADWTDAQLAASGAGEKLAAAAASEKNLIDAIVLLEKNGPRLPSGSGKRAALSVLAQLRELSGSFSAAAETWSAAASAEDGKQDERCLLESSRCLIAVGEMDRASAHIRTVLLISKDEAALSRAKLFGAYVAAFQRDDGALRLLKTFAADAAYAGDKATILFLAARIFGDKNALDQLLSEFPDSPEAGITAGSIVRLASLPLWLLPAARTGLTLSSAAPPGDTSPAKKTGTADAASTNASPPPTAGRQTASSSEPITLQVGLFKAEKNARSLAARLTSKGFAASVSARTVSGVGYWVVTVAPGSSAQDTTMRLKDAGFESFPSF